MRKWLKNILGFVITGFLLWYLAKHWGELKALLKLSPLQPIIFLRSQLAAGSSVGAIDTGACNIVKRP